MNAPSSENPVKKLLKEGKPVIGATITIANVESAVLTASLGFDFLWIEMEHSPITLETARNMVLATRGLKALPFIRVPVNELWTAKRVLDMGALGVIFPFTSSPALAQQAVDATHYPPIGKRGFGPRLAEARWPAEQGYATFANDNVTTIIMVEEACAVGQIDEIAATPAIDAIFIGTSDLSYSLGVGGQMNSPILKDAIAKVQAAGRKAGVPVGRPVRDAVDLQAALAEGFLFIQGPSDLVMMQHGATPLLDILNKTLDPKTRALY